MKINKKIILITVLIILIGTSIYILKSSNLSGIALLFENSDDQTAKSLYLPKKIKNNKLNKNPALISSMREELNSILVEEFKNDFNEIDAKINSL